MNNKINFCGKIILLGKSNVGKSTLLNQIIGEKISIVSHKKNTTQQKTIGIKTNKNYQYIYIDTPGITKNIYCTSFLLNQQTKTAIKLANIILFIFDKNNFTMEDEKLLKYIKKNNKPLIIAINKIDLINNKLLLLPFMHLIQKKIDKFIKIIPISAKKKYNIDILISEIKKLLPKSKHEYSSQISSNNSINFIISEIVREKIIQNFREEIPYIIKIKIESINIQNNGNYNISILLLVNNHRQKKIIIGKKGDKIKFFSTLSRKEIEKKIKTKVFLKIWVLIKDNLN